MSRYTWPVRPSFTLGILDRVYAGCTVTAAQYSPTVERPRSFARSLARSRHSSPARHTFLVRETTRGRDLKFSLARKTLSVRSIKDNGV